MSTLTESRSTLLFVVFFFFNDTATTEIYTLSLHDALPIWAIPARPMRGGRVRRLPGNPETSFRYRRRPRALQNLLGCAPAARGPGRAHCRDRRRALPSEPVRYGLRACRLLRATPRGSAAP